MKKYCLAFFCCLLSIFSLCACAPETQTWQATVELSEIDGLPEGMEGNLTCTVTYVRGEKLSVVVQNNTEYDLMTGSGDQLYRRTGEDQWERVEDGAVAYGLVGWITAPGESITCAAGPSNPKLARGDYKAVIGVSLSVETAEEYSERYHFDLELPFAVR